MKKSKYIDHTLLKATATYDEILKLCSEAKQYDFASVCVNPANVTFAHQLLEDSGVKVCTVIGFPLGANTKEVKAFEVIDAIKNGADEVDMVINIGMAKAHNWDAVYEDIKAVVDAANGVLVKVIIETCYLTDEEKEIITNIIINCGADFVKTSTGFGTKGATVEDIKLLNKIVNGRIKIKAAGGIHSLKDAQDMISNGATRLGVSKSVQIMEEYYDSNSTQRM